MNDGTDIVMPVTPAYNGGGMGGFGYGSDWWLILILLFACGGWGGFGGGFGGFGGGFGRMADLAAQAIGAGNAPAEEKTNEQ